MDHLLRRQAPITDAAWREIDEEARERLTPLLAARRVVDWNGPHGWTWSATPLGRIEALTEPLAGATSGAGETRDAVRLRRRRVLPATEVRVRFTLERADLDDVCRGAIDVDLDTLDQAAQRIAKIENRAVFHGWSAAGIEGVISTHPSMPLGEETETYPSTIARAVNTLERAGVGGPYALVVGPAGYTRIVQTAENGGLPLVEHLGQILHGPVVWAPGVEGALVLSQRGGDFLFECGQDLAVGYLAHDADSVELYLEESFTFRCVEDDAAVILTD